MGPGTGLVAWALDEYDERRRVLLPPRRILARTSSATRRDFVEVGARLADQLRRLGGLGPDMAVLEIGSGVGRVAIPLTRYLRAGARFEGVDMWAQGVAWCQERITPLFANFRFRVIDIRNDRFNPNGLLQAPDYELPYDEGSFDFVFACAVNHLDAADVCRFAVEAGRLLRSGGTYLGTWFLVDDANAGLLPDRCRPVACREDDVLATFAAAGLAIREIHRGAWSGTAAVGFQQDIVVATASA